MIRVRLEKEFRAGPESQAFRLDVDFAARSGVTVLFGPSGSGKTLTLDAIAGFVRPDAGRILLDKQVLFDSGEGVSLPARRRRCGYVFQHYALFPQMTIRGNLEFAAERLPREERAWKVNRMLDRFRLSDVAGRRPHEVSGGQKQRCSIARALVGEPRLLLLDEPARGLDAPLREELYAVLRQVRREFGTPILLVTHDLEECFELGEEVLILEDGLVVQAGPPKQVLDNPATIGVARLLGRFVILDGELLEDAPEKDRIRIGELEATLPAPAPEGCGGRVRVAVRPDRVVARPASNSGEPGGASRLLLKGFREGSRTVRLEFRGGLAAEMRPAEFAPNRDNKEWEIEFPAGSTAIFPSSPR